jgi:acyl-CoA thioester hydrolase
MYSTELEVIWSNLDANRHMRNTAYSEFATHGRIDYFNEHGYSLDVLGNEGIGPVLLKEEVTYFREVKMQDKLKITVTLSRSTANYDRYTISQDIIKENGKKAARVIIHGAWMNLNSRQLVSPPQKLVEKVILNIPRTEDYEVVGFREYIFV